MKEYYMVMLVTNDLNFFQKIKYFYSKSLKTKYLGCKKFEKRVNYYTVKDAVMKDLL